jgi:Ran GTPase-activating protein (RanGAP) involved in mRNA processing and transport
VFIDAGVGDEHAEAIAERLPSCVKAVDLGHNLISAEGACLLLPALGKNDLASLSLACNFLTPAVSGALERFVSASASLRFLDLSGNACGSRWVRALPQTAVEDLRLAGCSLGPSDAAAIAEVLPDLGLRALDLSFNQLQHSVLYLASAMETQVTLRTVKLNATAAAETDVGTLSAYLERNKSLAEIWFGLTWALLHGSLRHIGDAMTSNALRSLIFRNYLP